MNKEFKHLGMYGEIKPEGILKDGNVTHERFSLWINKVRQPGFYFYESSAEIEGRRTINNMREISTYGSERLGD